MGFVVDFYDLFKMLTHTVDVSDYTSLYHLILYAYFNVCFRLLLLPLAFFVCFDLSGCHFCFLEKAVYKKHPKNRALCLKHSAY